MLADLDAEFWRAIRFAKEASAEDPRLDWPIHRVQFGFARVDFYGEGLYEPHDGGRTMAVVAPVVEDGELIDLCAIDPHSDRFGQRFDLGHGLGIDSLSTARMRCCDLLLVDRAMMWLYTPLTSSITTRAPVEPIFLFRLNKLRRIFKDTNRKAPFRFTCSSIPLAQRVAAMLPPSERSRIQLDTADDENEDEDETADG